MGRADGLQDELHRGVERRPCRHRDADHQSSTERWCDTQLYGHARRAAGLDDTAALDGESAAGS